MQETSIEFTRKVSPDVLAGMRLYGNVTNELEPGREEESLANWTRWFEGNPEGDGYFAIGKSGERVVGFRSIIPLAMQLRGQRVRGGKGEFFVVDPEFRRSAVKDTNQLLPIVLQGGLRDWAYGQGLQAHFGVGTPGATMLALLTGGKLLEFPCTYYSFPFERSFTGRGKASKGSAPVRWAMRRAMPALRFWARLRSRRAPGITLEEISSIPLDHAERCSDRNQFLYADSETLDFRFPRDRYVKLLVRREDGADQVVFVFSKPEWDKEVRLFYWSPRLKLSAELLSLAIVEIIGRCASAGARKLTVVLPEHLDEASAELRKLGFRTRKGTEQVSLHFRDLDNRAELNPQRWAFNLAHQRLYQES